MSRTKNKKKYDGFLSAPEGLDRHWAYHGAKLKEKRNYRSQDVYLADGGPHFDAGKVKGLTKEEEWMKKGYYVSVFAIQIRKAFFGYPLYFKINHDLEYNNEDRSKRRLNAAYQHAKQIIDDGISLVDPPIFHEHSIIAVPQKSKLILPSRLH